MSSTRTFGLQQACHAYFTGSVATQRTNGNTALAYLYQTAM
jgi:hypothetical protein